MLAWGKNGWEELLFSFRLFVSLIRGLNVQYCERLISLLKGGETANPIVFLFYRTVVAELKRTSLSQSIEPLSKQNVSANSFVNLFII